MVFVQGIAPSNVLVLSFTKGAAQEFKDRVAKDISAAKSMEVCTFHSLSLALLREHRCAATRIALRLQLD